MESLRRAVRKLRKTGRFEMFLLFMNTIRGEQPDFSRFSDLQKDDPPERFYEVFESLVSIGSRTLSKELDECSKNLMYSLLLTDSDSLLIRGIIELVRDWEEEEKQLSKLEK